MGNDGGSFGHRAEMVKMKKREKKLESKEVGKMKAELCTLSKEKLKRPICICKMGQLYNKEEVVKRLAEKEMPNQGYDHIKRMRDIKEIKSEKVDQIICPITMTVFNGMNKFVCFWDCGCIVSVQAFELLKKTMEGAKKCLNCDAEIQT